MFEALCHATENDMLAIKVRRVAVRDEELGAVGVRPGIGHRQKAGSGVFDQEVLILELCAVDRFSAGAVTVGEVASLHHEVVDDAMEGASFEVQGFARFASALFAGAQGTEVLCGFRHYSVVELHLHASKWFVSLREVEEHLHDCDNNITASVLGQPHLDEGG